ncbi:MAG: MBL fold metallo-hydrolase [Chloroflexi bacterium]|nr:MBL fold metallo-hydrolase [Chloroflexota bacterium]
MRGSYPVPGPRTVRYGGNTTCVEVRAGGHLIIIDAGTGLIHLGYELMHRHQETGEPIIATILFSHTHHDHTQGFPFFRPAYLGSSTLYMFGPKLFREDLSEALSRAMLPPAFPVELEELNSLKIMRNIEETEVIILRPGVPEPGVRNVYRQNHIGSPDQVEIRLYKGYAHPKVGILIYRISWQGRSMVFASDTEGYVGHDERLIEFAQGTDLLIHDAQYTEEEYTTGRAPKQGYGHSTPQMAANVAKRAGVGQLALFHHDPRHSDDQLAEMERQAQGIFANTIAAYEGLEIVL